MTITEHKQALGAAIDRFFVLEQKAAPTTEARLLLNRTSELIRRGGKRARPELFYMTYLAYGGTHTTALVDLGVALELYHQSLLVHDDIIDKDTVRYDGPNVAGYYLQDQPAVGRDVAEAMELLAGDILFFICQSCSY